MAEKTEKNPRGAGRKATGVKRVSICISGQPEQIEELKNLAKASGKNTSEYIFEKTGVKKMSEKKDWFVANDDGDIAGHDMSEAKAKALAEELNKTVFYISYGEGYVSYDNKATSDFDNSMKFDTEKEAENYLEEIQTDWVSKLTVCKFIDDSNWEALKSDED